MADGGGRRVLVPLLVVALGGGASAGLAYWRWQGVTFATRITRQVERAQAQAATIAGLLQIGGPMNLDRSERLSLTAARLDGLLLQISESTPLRKVRPVLDAIDKHWPRLRRRLLVGLPPTLPGGTASVRSIPVLSSLLRQLSTIKRRWLNRKRVGAMAILAAVVLAEAALLAWAVWRIQSGQRDQQQETPDPEPAREAPHWTGADPPPSALPPAPAPVLGVEHERQYLKMEALGRLAGGVAHDFNNVLTAVSGFSQLALSHLPYDHSVRPWVEHIRKSAKRGAELTSQLLAFGRRQVLNVEVLALGDVVEEILPMLRRLIDERIEIRLDLDSRESRVRADRSQIEQTVLNLVLNGRDAMPEGGTLEIRTCTFDATEGANTSIPTGAYSVLEVRDTGCGMDTATRSRIFDPFFTTKTEGTGLGLSTVYGIVKQSGGYVTVDSELGKGSTFRIYLPRSSDPITDAADTPTSPASHLESSGSTVLVAEDADEVRAFVVEALRSQGFHVLAAANGLEAIRVATDSGTSIDLLVTDMIMPGMSGPELARRLGETQEGVRVLFISGYAGAAATELTDLGSSADFLAKPFSPSELGRRVRALLHTAPSPSSPG